MINFLQTRNAIRFTLCMFLAVVALTIMPEAFAANPLDGISITPGGDTQNLGGMMKFWIFLIVLALTFIIVFFALGDSILAVFGSLKEARRTNEWGDFFKSLLMIFIGIGITLFIAFIMFMLLEKFPELWDQMMGSNNP